MIHSATLRFAAVSSAALAATAATLLLWPVVHSDAAGLCPNIDDTILNCKSQGQDYQMNTRPDGCKIAECIAPGSCPVFKNEVRTCRLSGYDYKSFWDERRCQRAQCIVDAENENGCPMAWDIAMRKIKNCESEPGLKAVVNETATCLEFVSCERVKETSTTPGDVVCRKRMENSCTIIKCDDGFSWNSCASAGSSSSVSSGAAVSGDPCLAIQIKAKEADEALKLKKRDITLRNILNSLKVELKQCRLKASKK